MRHIAAIAIVTMLLCLEQTLLAQDLPAPPPPQPSSAANADTFSNSLAERIWISLQANIIVQQHPSFDAAYSGASSLRRAHERATSYVETLYTGARLTRQLELLFDLESTGGSTFSGGRGLGGVTNVDAPIDPTPGGARPYVSRAMLHYTIALTTETTLATRNPLALSSTVPTRRLELRIGKMSPIDFFDLNGACNDGHSQFTNIAIVNNGAFDYAADLRGYTYGAVAEYYDASWALRFGEMLIPYGADSAHPGWSPARGHSENLEFEYHTNALLHRESVMRALAFMNDSPTARYSDALAAWRAGEDDVPDTGAHRMPGVRKVGFGLNAEHALSDDWRAFWRLGWNDGESEPNPIDHSAAAGIDVHGTRWHRADDEIGAAIVVNGLSRVHRQYLESGGQSSGLGDGLLTYGPERIIETYYNAALRRGLSFTVSYQLVTHPAFNRDRGPVSVLGFRVHVERGR